MKEILLVLRSMGGVAHTTGSSSHKEIHYSLDYIRNTKHRAPDEIMGILVHEVVHCFQYDGRGHCPSGLTEGIAGTLTTFLYNGLLTKRHEPKSDYVRLQKKLGPPHWRRRGGEEWHMGYEGTAYFLEWIEQSLGKNTFVQDLNGRMKKRYHPTLFDDLTGKSVDDLWKSYCGTLDKVPTDVPAPVPTHTVPKPTNTSQ